MRLGGEAHYDGTVGQHGGTEESRPLYSQALSPGARSPMAVRDGAGAPGEVWAKRRHHLDLFSRN